MYGREKRWGEPNWKRRLGYALLGELHVPGRLRSWHIIRELERMGLWGPRPLSVYDAGGGEGAFGYYVARRFPTWRVVIGDNEPRTLARGRAIKTRLGLSNLDIVDVDLRDLGEEARYDLVVCADVLEHIDEDDQVIKHLAHALGPGGVLVVTSPSVPQPRHLPIVSWRERWVGFEPLEYGHVRQGYSEQALRRLFDDCGLTTETIRFTFGRFGTLMFDVFFATGDNRPNPAVYLALFPFYIGLAALDVRLPSRHGAGILGVARRA